MATRDVTDTLNRALGFTGLNRATVSYCPSLLSDKEPSYVSGELREWLESQGMAHTRGTPYYHMTQGKIERYHRSIKNHALLENYYLPRELKHRIKQSADYYNYERYQESLDSLTLAEVYNGQGE